MDLYEPFVNEGEPVGLYQQMADAWGEPRLPGRAFDNANDEAHATLCLIRRGLLRAEYIVHRALSAVSYRRELEEVQAEIDREFEANR